MRKKAWRKNIAFLLVIAMMLTIMPVTVFAEGENATVVTITPSSDEVTTGQVFSIAASVTTGSAITTPSMVWYVNGITNGSQIFDGGNASYTTEKEFSFDEAGDYTIKAEFLNDALSIGSAECTVTVRDVVNGVITANMTQQEIDDVVDSSDIITVEAGNYDYKIIRLDRDGLVLELGSEDSSDIVYEKLRIITEADAKIFLRSDVLMLGECDATVKGCPVMLFVKEGNTELNAGDYTLTAEGYTGGIRLGQHKSVQDRQSSALNIIGGTIVLQKAIAKGESSDDGSAVGSAATGTGIFIYSESGTVNNVLTVDGATVNIIDNPGVGIYRLNYDTEGEAINTGSSCMTFKDSKIRIDSSSGGYSAISDESYNSGNIVFLVDNSELILANSKANGYTGSTPNRIIEIRNGSKIVAYGNASAGIKFDVQELHIYDSELYAEKNGSFGFTGMQNADIQRSIIHTVDNKLTGTVFYGNSTISDNSKIISEQDGERTWAGSRASAAATRVYPGTLVITDSSYTMDSISGIAYYNTSSGSVEVNISKGDVIAINADENKFETSSELYDDWNTAYGNTGRTIITGGSLQAIRSNMSGSELYYKDGKLNILIPDKYEGNKTEYQYTAPINQYNTALTRFDFHIELNQEVGGNSQQKFVYYDPNNNEQCEYEFRYNGNSEKLQLEDPEKGYYEISDEKLSNNEDLTEGESGNAYVWAPVSILHFDAAEGIVNNADSTAVIGNVALTNTRGDGSEVGNTGNEEQSSNRYATDYTIYGNSLQLSEGVMPTAEKDGAIFRGWYAADDEEKAAEIAASAETKDDFIELYALLNTEFTEASKVSADLTDVAKAQEEKTIYAKWAAAKIEGTVFHDTEVSRNNQYDAGEDTFADIKVSLKNAAGDVVSTTTTDENGHYEFYLDQIIDQENGDTYTVELAVYPDSMSKICAINEAEQGNKFAGEKASATVKVKQGDMKTANAGFYQTGMIEGYVFEDVQNDDIARDNIYVAGTDKALSDVEVQLYQMSHDSNEYFLVDEMVTDAAGYYYFDNLIPGERYFVYVKRPEAYNTNCAYAYNQENLDGNRFSVSTVVTGENGVALYCSDIISIVANNTERVNAGFYITERDPETPITPTTPGDGDDDTWTPSDPTPTNPSTEIPDPDVPLTEPDIPPVVIEDPDVPLVDVPGEPVVEIEEPEIPLGDAPKTGDTAPMVAFAGLMAAAVVGLVITRRKFN